MNVEQVKSIDEAMGLAIEHSYQVKGTTYPKPPVGAVIVDPNGRIVGAGGTEPAGGDHAEVVALRRAGGLAAGAIVVVTMEPCNHYGKTPPCVNALIEARVGTVVYAVADPNGIAGVARAGCQQRAYRCGPGCWLNRWRPDRCGSGSTSNAPVCRMSPGSTPPASTAAAPPPTAPASGSPARPHAWICIAAAPSPTRSWSAPAPSSPTTRP